MHVHVQMYMLHIHVLSLQISFQLSAATIEINPKVLNLCCKDLDLEVDPFFKQMFALFDEGHEEGFMLCQVITRYVNVLKHVYACAFC